ncbi:sugar kinase [Streptomyces sp. MST-110588]|uniref:carbohydrate kinase family protein n=1 Tax=Streptomyces sp. MST-110588 TaxID=2833628 RepID=UPI001F5E005F|nr:sugar kinase [Streptomyces sp. MST-110588]UNO39096.1 sugar kinase [Streptomyces sp. MST-110588]
MSHRSRETDVLVIGDANPDVVLGPVPHPLHYGQREQLVASADLTVGGSAAITACGAARLGLRVAFAGRVGDDAAGRFVRTALADRGVDVTALATDPGLPTPLTAVLTRDGDRAVLTAPGCLAATGPGDVPAALLAGSRHVHAASYFLMPRLAQGLAGLFERAREHGATTSLDTNDDPSRRWDTGALAPVLKATGILLPNAAEARALAGDGTRDALPDGTGNTARDTAADEAGIPSQDLVAAAGRLARFGPLVVVKDGANGALAHDGAAALAVPAVPAAPVDTVGAGDSFDAGFLAAVLGGMTTYEALRFAAACGALSTRAPGGTAAQPTWDEARAAAAPTPGSPR